MGEEKDIGWGACFVSNPLRSDNGNYARLCKRRVGLEIDESITIAFGSFWIKLEQPWR